MEEKQNDEKIKRFYKLAYEAYKRDWMRRINADRQIDSLLNYWYENCEDELSRSSDSYENYLKETGYDNELYVCFDEFMGAEFRDRGYMKGLLRFDENPNLEALYNEAVVSGVEPDEKARFGYHYILVSVCDRGICNEGIFSTIDDAKEAMRQEMLECRDVSRDDLYDPDGTPKEEVDADDYIGLTDDGAYVNDKYESAWSILTV